MTSRGPAFSRVREGSSRRRRYGDSGLDETESRMTTLEGMGVGRLMTVQGVDGRGVGEWAKYGGSSPSASSGVRMTVRKVNGSAKGDSYQGGRTGEIRGFFAALRMTVRKSESQQAGRDPVRCAENDSSLDAQNDSPLGRYDSSLERTEDGSRDAQNDGWRGFTGETL